MMNHEYGCGCGCGNQVEPIVCPTEYRCHDQFMTREVPYIHPIVNVNRHHVVDVPKHYFTETTVDVMGAPMHPQGGFGPELGGGYGPEFGRRGRRRGCDTRLW